MWDSIWGDGALRRAEDTFEQLQNEIWKDLIKEGAQIVKFYNTQESAISILDQCLDSSRAKYFTLEVMIRESQAIQNTPFAVNLYDDLRDRVMNLESERCNLHADLVQAEWDDGELRDVLRARLDEVEEDLARFTQELGEFGSPPDPRSSGSAIPAVIPHLPQTLPSPRHNVASFPPPSGTDFPSPRIIASSTVLENQERAMVHRHQPQRGRFGRAIHSVRCWGKAVEERHVN